MASRDVGTVTVGGDLLNGATMTVRVARVMTMRLRIAVGLIRLAAWVVGCGYAKEMDDER